MSAVEVDTARLPLLLHDLRLPAISRLWPDIAARSDKEGWPAARLLSVLAEIELAERVKRRMERHMAESRLPPGKTIESFDFSVVPMISKALFMALAAGDTWLEKGSNLLLFGPPGSGKTHASAALGRSLIENGYRVLFLRTTELVQRLQAARQSCSSKQHWPSSINMTCSSCMICPTSPRIRLKPVCCSSSSARVTNVVHC